MRLIECHIENFGKLHDRTVTFTSGIHLIRESNGWGKSTLAAFLRVMFFGFEGENKRKGIENERKRYAPWQGGVYGGQVTFEAAGKVYTATRIFSDKKANDTFELRDEATNKKCADFSDALGEELFAINAESFARTVFLGQNDCVTYATDSINAKMGNIADNLNDLDCYENATSSLQEVLNYLTPQRKTGRLSRLNDEITRMQTETSQESALEEAIQDCSRREAEAEEQLCEKNRQQEDLFALSQQAVRAQDRKARQAAYQQMQENCARAEKAYQQASRWFPKEVPSEEEIRMAMDACDAMERAEERAQMYLVTAGEQEQLQVLKEATLENLQSLQAERKTSPRRSRIALILCGAICAGLGLVLYQDSTWQWTLLPLAGAVLVVAGVLMWRQDSHEETRQQDAIEKMQQDLVAEQSAQQEAMDTKQQNYQTYRKQYQQQLSRVEEQIRRIGLVPTEPFKEQLREIWRHLLEWQREKEEVEAMQSKKRAFESENEGAVWMTEQEEALPSLEELQQRQKQGEDEMEQLRVRKEGYGRQLASLRDKKEELEITRERLAEGKAKRDSLRQQYEDVRLTQRYLTVAKEAMTAKYMDPLMRSFSKYYQILTGEPAAQYRIDANMNVTVEECGMQRETILLSRGWQDLVGLCLRLALVDAMYPEEKPFLILDDPLVSLDEERTAGGKRLMRALAQEYQVVYFTCK